MDWSKLHDRPLVWVCGDWRVLRIGTKWWAQFRGKGFQMFPNALRAKESVVTDAASEFAASVTAVCDDEMLRYFSDWTRGDGDTFVKLPDWKLQRRNGGDWNVIYRGINLLALPHQHLSLFTAAEVQHYLDSAGCASAIAEADVMADAKLRRIQERLDLAKQREQAEYEWEMNRRAGVPPEFHGSCFDTRDSLPFYLTAEMRPDYADRTRLVVHANLPAYRKWQTSELATLYVEYRDGKLTANVSWSAIGSMDLDFTQSFAHALSQLRHLGSELLAGKIPMTIEALRSMPYVAEVHL